MPILCRMRLPSLFPAIFIVSAAFPAARAQLSGPDNLPIRVTVSQNDDGSQTSYETDPSNHRATGTTTGTNGKLVQTIRYKLDDAGRYLSGDVSGPDGKLRYRSVYKYDSGNGRLVEETQLTGAGAVKLRLVFAYDGAGKQAGYSVYDAGGNLLGRTSKKQ